MLYAISEPSAFASAFLTEGRDWLSFSGWYRASFCFRAAGVSQPVGGRLPRFNLHFIKSLRLRPPTPEAYGKTADFGTLCIPGSSQRLDPSAAAVAPARCIECHADSLSCPLTQLYIPGVPGGVQRGSRGSRGFATSHKTRKIRQTFRSCLSSLTRSCIQDCVQEVPVGQMAQGTPPSAHAAAFQGGFNRLHQLLHGFFTKSQVKSFQNHLPS